MYRYTGPENFDSGFRQPEFPDGVKLLTPVEGNGALVRLVSSEPELPEVAKEPEMDLASITEELTSPGVLAAPEKQPDWSARGVPFGAVLRAIGDCRDEPTLANESAALLDELAGLEQRICLLVSQHRERKFANLRERWESARAAARAALDTFKSFQLESPPVEGDLRRARQGTSKCRAEVTSLEDARPAPETYPTRLEMKQWERDLQSAKDALTQAQGREREISEQLAEIVGRLRAQRTELEKRAQVEADLRTALAGKPVRDREYGFLVPAEKF
jgi:hypothetical protein